MEPPPAEHLSDGDEGAGTVALTGQAGASAQEWEQRLRAKAARLEARADRLASGQTGEHTTSAALSAAPASWSVHHDLAMPRSRANIDHVVVTPAGVWVVDSKHWTGVTTVDGGILRVDGRPRSKGARTLAWMRQELADELAWRLPEQSTPVEAIICVTATPPKAVGEVDATAVLGVSDLVRHLAAQPARLTDEEVALASWAVRQSFPARTASTPTTPRPSHRAPTAPTTPTVPATAVSRVPLSGAQQAPAPAPAPARGRALVTPRTAVPAPRRTPPPPGARPAGVPARRRARARRSATPSAPAAGVAIAIAIAAVVVGPVAIKLLPSLAERLAPPLAASATSVVTPDRAAPLAPELRWSCPPGDHGWTGDVVWPPGANVAGLDALETAPSSSGPWRIVSTSTWPDPPTLAGVPAGTSERVRAGTFVALSAGSRLVQGVVTAPAGCEG